MSTPYPQGTIPDEPGPTTLADRITAALDLDAAVRPGLGPPAPFEDAVAIPIGYRGTPAAATIPTNRALFAPVFLPAGSYGSVSVSVSTAQASTTIGVALWRVTRDGNPFGAEVARNIDTDDVLASTGVKSLTFDAFTSPGDWFIVGVAGDASTAELLTVAEVVGMPAIDPTDRPACWSNFKASGNTNPTQGVNSTFTPQDTRSVFPLVTITTA